MAGKERVLVVGGATGIGLAIAKGALTGGAEVIVASSNADKVTKAAALLGPAAQGQVLDVTDEAAVAHFFETSGSFDHIAFTAGDWSANGMGSVAHIDLTLAPKQFDVRFWGVLRVGKYGATKLPPGGSYTFTSGMIVHTPAKGWALAAAGAGAIESLARAMAVDLAPIRVNCVCAGMIQTGLWDGIPEEQRDAQLLKMAEKFLVPRPGQPAEAAEAYLYLMRNRFVTGQVLQVSGGSELGR